MSNIPPSFFRPKLQASSRSLHWRRICARMRESRASITPQFSANRMVREYVEKYYLRAVAVGGERSANEGTTGAHILNWRQTLVLA